MPGVSVALEEVAVLPVWIENNAVGRARNESRNIQPVLIDREVEEVTARLALLAARPAPLDKETRAQKALLERRLEGSKHRRERILRMLPEGFAVASPELRQRGTAAVPPGRLASQP